MKTIKLLAVAVATLITTACSNNDENKFTYNTLSGATVEMEDATVEVMENTGLFKVPVEVKGDRNGYITITIECTETGNDPAIANRHYYLTSDRINIPADAKTAVIEFRTNDGRGADPDRTFNVSIVSAQGATVGAQKTTTVTILEKGSSPLFSELPGTYLISGSRAPHEGENPEENVEFIDQVSMSIVSEDGHGGGVVRVNGVMGMFQMLLTYEYDEEEKYGQLVFNYGTIALPNSGYDKVAWTNSQGSLEGAPVVGKWNSNYTATTFGDEQTRFGISIYDPGFLGTAEVMYGFTLMRVPVAAE